MRALAPVLLACSLLLACDKGASPPPSSGGAVTTPPPNPTPATDPPADPTPAPATGPACGDKTCAADEECISYYGIAGPRGPKFEECGIRCKADGGCPDGKKCQTIADGPGPVCR